MADKYTYADVIIDPEDPRAVIGKEYYWADIAYDVLKMANKDGGTGTLEKVSHDSDLPSVIKTDCSCACLIRKKEPEKKYMPFNLSKEEDRARLRGAWVRERESKRELVVTAIYLDEKPPFIELNDNGISVEGFLEGYEFVDGSPCGKLVEEEE